MQTSTTTAPPPPFLLLSLLSQLIIRFGAKIVLPLSVLLFGIIASSTVAFGKLHVHSWETEAATTAAPPSKQI